MITMMFYFGSRGIIARVFGSETGFSLATPFFLFGFSVVSEYVEQHTVMANY
ncbi:unnamed protein product [Ectocarpus sp. CCAP 1310/34]|nr:unnamed protein product [Ectocarpus sp. CCAP 1310/34]